MSADRVGRTWGRVVAVSALPLLSWPSVTGSLRSKRTHPIGSKADELQPGRSQLLVRDAELGIPGDLPEVAVGVAGSPVGIIAHSWNACLRHGQPPLAAKPPCGAYWEQCRERASWRATRSCTSPLTSLLSAENAAKLNALNTHAHQGGPDLVSRAASVRVEHKGEPAAGCPRACPAWQDQPPLFSRVALRIGASPRNRANAAVIGFAWTQF